MGEKLEECMIVSTFYILHLIFYILSDAECHMQNASNTLQTVTYSMYHRFFSVVFHKRFTEYNTEYILRVNKMKKCMIFYLLFVDNASV